jgi:hypothetical protein
MSSFVLGAFDLCTAEIDHSTTCLFAVFCKGQDNVEHLVLPLDCRILRICPIMARIWQSWPSEDVQNIVDRYTFCHFS